MNLIPPILDDARRHATACRSEQDLKNILKDATADPDVLFSSSVPTLYSFGANDVWSYYCGDWDVSRSTFFPDVGIFSSKVRLIDLYREYYYACYSQYSEASAVRTLRRMMIPIGPVLKRTIHPYVLVARNWLADISFPRDKGALFMIPKSTDAVERKFDDEALAKAIDICLSHADRVTICVYYRDLERYLNTLSFCNVRVVCCGSRYDALFYFRLNYLFRSHSFVSYFEPGSHSLFASISELPQLQVSADVKKVFSKKSSYQERRYPLGPELREFNAVTERLKSAQSPILLPELRGFLDFDPRGNNILSRSQFKNSYAEGRYIWYKIVRKFVRFADNIDRIRY